MMVMPGARPAAWRDLPDRMDHARQAMRPSTDNEALRNRRPQDRSAIGPTRSQGRSSA